MRAPLPSARHRVKRPYHVMVKAVGPICNLACSYCYYLEKTALYPGRTQFRMDDEMLERFVRSYLASHPGDTVVFPWHGGEPMLMGIDFYRRALELQQKYLPANWKCLNVLQTNGFLLDEEWARFLAASGMAVGLSLDGPARHHDAVRPDKRGQPTHERVLRGLRLLQEHGVTYNVLCAVSSVNAGAPLEVYGFFRELGVTAMQFIPIVRPEANGRVSAQSVAARDYGDFLIAAFDEWLRSDFGRVWVQNFEECLAQLRGQGGSLCVFQKTCGDSLALEHNGDLFACDHFVTPQWKLGNLRERSMKALVESPLLQRFARAKSEALPGCCRRCEVRAMCHGGCPKDRFTTSPEGERGLNYFCEGYRRFFLHARSRLAPGRPGNPAATAASARPGRNDACPCGSGRKYKRCCGAPASRIG